MIQKHGLGVGVVLYGEIYGKGIQKGYDYGLDEIKFVGFDVMENGEYLDNEKMNLNKTAEDRET